MHVVALEARHLRVPLRRPVRHASHTRTDTDNIVVRCELSDGSVGWGEGVPRDYVTGETVDSAIDLLRRSDLGKQLASCHEFEQVVRAAERLALTPVPDDDRMCRGNAARCAVELAYLDAYGRALGEPLMNVTKWIAPELYEPHDRVQYSGVILSAKGGKARALSLYYRITGFRHVKVKVGIAGHDDTQRLRTIRRWLGRGVDVRVDANESWTPTDTVDRIRTLEPFGVTSVEQPVRHEDVACLAEVRSHIQIPVMLDESFCGEVDAERALAGGWADLFNLRLSKCGGLIPSLKLAAYAMRHGLGYQLGCQVGETAILSAAGRQFATSVKGIRCVEGSFDRHLLDNWLSPDDITFGRGGWAPMLTGSGLGVSIDPARVDALTVRREVLVGGT